MASKRSPFDIKKKKNFSVWEEIAKLADLVIHLV